jgi:hypothetical protein
MSPCSRQGKRSLLTSCMGRRSGSDEETTSSAEPPLPDRRPVSPHGQGRTWIGGGHHYQLDGVGGGEHEDGFEDNYFRRRPKSFCIEGRRFGGAGSGVVDVATSRQLSQLSTMDESYLRSLAMVSKRTTVERNIPLLVLVLVIRCIAAACGVLQLLVDLGESW